MKGFLVDEMGLDGEEAGLTDMLLEQFADRINSKASAEGPASVMTAVQKSRIQASYDRIGTLGR